MRLSPARCLVLAVACVAACGFAGCGTAAPARPAGATLRIGPGQSVSGVLSLGRRVDVRGRVREDVSVLGADATIRRGAAVGGNVVVVGGDLQVEPGARVGGLIFDLNLSSARFGEVMGVVSLWAAWEIFRILATLGVMVLGLLLAAVAPRWVGVVGERTRTNPWAVARVGLWSVVLALLGGGALAATLIGLPVAAGLGILVLFAAVIGLAGVGHWLGDALAARLAADWPGGVRKVALGLGTILGFSFVPFLGPLLLAVAFLLGFGAAVTALHGWVRRSSST